MNTDSDAYFLNFHYVLSRLHKNESLAFFALDAAAVSQWMSLVSQEDSTQEGYAKAGAAKALVEQVIRDVQPTMVIFGGDNIAEYSAIVNEFKAQKIATVCHMNHASSDTELSEQQKHLLRQVDLVYASTAGVSDRILTQLPSQPVLTGLYPPYLCDLLLHDSARSSNRNQPLTIGYLGIGRPPAGLDGLVDDIASLLDGHPKIRFETLGVDVMPSALKAFERRTWAYPADSDYRKTLSQLQQLNWDIGLAPLATVEADCRTSFTSAAIAYVTYTACGIPTIASQGSCDDRLVSGQHLLLAEQHEWYDHIQQLMNNEPMRTELVSQSQAHCTAAYGLEAQEARLKELMASV